MRPPSASTPTESEVWPDRWMAWAAVPRSPTSVEGRGREPGTALWSAAHRGTSVPLRAANWRADRQSVVEGKGRGSGGGGSEGTEERDGGVVRIGRAESRGMECG